MKRPEDALQRSVVEYLSFLENQGRLRYFAVPNGGKRSKIEAAIMKGLGVRAGVPDLCVLASGGQTIFFELKSPTGKLTKSQEYWHFWNNIHGFRTATVRTLDEVKYVLSRADVISDKEAA